MMSAMRRIAQDIGLEMGRNARAYPSEQHMVDGLPTRGSVNQTLRPMLEDVRAVNDDPDLRPGHGPLLFEEVLEALTAENQDNLRVELVQVCAVAVRWIADIDSRKDGDN